MSTFVALLVLVVAACTWGAPAGWRGAGVHLVDGTWLGTEMPCAEDAGASTCRILVDEAVQALTPGLRSKVTGAVLAELPTTYVTDTGEQRVASLQRGLDTRTAIVLDLADGTRRAVGLWCYLPRTAEGDVIEEAIGCRGGDLSDWREGNEPRNPA